MQSFYQFICQVSEDDIEEMFEFADKDGDGKISFLEFQLMINPPQPPVKLDSDAKNGKLKDSGKKVTIITNDSNSS